MSHNLTKMMFMVIVTVLLVVLPGQVFADTTSLDPSFGTSGKVILDLGADTSSYANAMLLLPDGKFLLAGRSTPSGQSQTAIILRLNSDGTIDTTFGSDGIVSFSWGQFSEIYDLARQSNGNIVAIGSDGAYAVSMLVIRLDSEGALDSGFGDQGVASISPESPMIPVSVAIQTNNRIVVAARKTVGSDGLTIFQLLENGTLDNTFGTNTPADGFATAPVTGTDAASAITLQSDGKIVVVGTTNADSFQSSTQDFAVARFNSNGTLDTDLDADGMTVVDIAGRSDLASAVLIQPTDGKIVIAGSAYMTSSRTDCAMVRLNPDGSPDTGFDSDGIATYYMYGLSSCESLSYQPDGSFIGAGVFAPSISRYFMVTHIKANGQPDLAFNNGLGFQYEGFTLNRAFEHAHVVQSDGRIILAGELDHTGIGTKYSIALAGFRTLNNPIGDFNSDGKPDVLWRNTSTGENYVWYLDGVTVIGGGALPPVSDQNWRVVGSADFNADSKPDILWRNVSTGENYIWYLDGVAVQGGGALPPVPDQNWKIVGVADFNNDGKMDVLWRNVSTGENYIWYLNGVAVQEGGKLPTIENQNWKIVGAADFNNDGKMDVLWRNVSTGENYIWYLNGAAVQGGGGLPIVADQNWKLVRAGDLNGDGNVDILWRNAASGEDYIWYLTGTSVTGGGSIPPVTDQNWKIMPQVY